MPSPALRDRSLAGRRTLDPTRPGHTRGRLRRYWDAGTGVVGALAGLVPHVLHHIGLLAGTALVAGSGGTALFAGVGLVASLPLLLRLRRRFGTWRAPVLGLTVFAVMFVLSAFVIGPAIGGGNGTEHPSVPAVDHTGHH